MERLTGAYLSMIDRYVTAKKPTVPFYSSVTGRLHACGLLEVSYWVENLVSPVLFNSAIQAVLDAQLQGEFFLEIGPHSALAGPLRQILITLESRAPYAATIVRGRDCSESLLTAVGELHTCSVPVNFTAMNPNGVVLTDLPAYPWNHEVKYWSESRVCREWRLRKFPRHEILGSRVMECTDLEPSWRNLLNLSDVPWLRDHKLHEDIVFPIAGYIAMVGEAIHQITGAVQYTLRDITVGKAMVFNDTNTMEIVSNFRPLRLTSTLESEWYEFSVSSYNGSEWTKHCVGQARGSQQPSSPNERIENLPRHLSTSKWYNVMKKAGLNYGSSFQGLRRISASTSEKIAVATISDFSDTFDDSYPLHPARIDCCLQLFSVAMAKGVPRCLNELWVPTSVEEVHIRRANSEILAKATIRSSQRSRISGDVTALAEGVTVMSIAGLGLSRLEENMPESESKRDAVARLTWKPDIDFLEPRLLIRSPQLKIRDLLLVEKLTLLCTIEGSNKFASAEIAPNHVGKYLSWLHLQKDRAERDEYDLVQDSGSYVKLDSTTRLSLIETLRKDISSTRLVHLGNCILRVFESFQSLYCGQVDPLEVLLHSGALNDLYGLFQFDYSELLGLLSHQKPNLRVLEVGAGTGRTTEVVLDCLTSEFGERMYSEYYYTDISAGFFANAKDRFKHAGNIKYSVLDISKDPLGMGYEEGSFDLVIAANVSSLH